MIVHAPTEGFIRHTRAGVVSALVISMSVFAHALGGGTVADFPVLAGAFAGCGAIAFRLAQWRFSFTSLVSLLGLGQLLMHEVLDASTHHSMALNGKMLAVHGVFTLLTAVVLAHGERALWSLWSRIVAIGEPVCEITIYVNSIVARGFHSHAHARNWGNRGPPDVRISAH